MRISDWSSDVCSADLPGRDRAPLPSPISPRRRRTITARMQIAGCCSSRSRSEEHTSELQSLMRKSYAVLCLKKKLKLRVKEIFHLLQLETTRRCLEYIIPVAIETRLIALTK